jgi:hypothetical protein
VDSVFASTHSPSPKPEDYIDPREVKVEGRTDAALIKSHATKL